LSDIVHVIAFIIGLQMPTGADEVLVQFRGLNTVYYSKQDCEDALKEYGQEHIMNEFLSGLKEDPDVVPFPKSMPMCVLYDMRSGQYPDLPQFDIPVNKPDDGQSANDRLGQKIPGSS